MPALSAEAVTAGYGRSPIINEISLTAELGTITTIIGPNGAGKSTFVKSLIGILRPMSGKVKVNDVDITKVPGHRIAGHGLVYLPHIDASAARAGEPVPIPGAHSPPRATPLHCLAHYERGQGHLRDAAQQACNRCPNRHLALERIQTYAGAFRHIGRSNNSPCPMRVLDRIHPCGPLSS